MQPNSWRVGVLFSETGATAAVDRTQRAATFLAIEEINRAGGILGRPIEAISYDPKSTPSLHRDWLLRFATWTASRSSSDVICRAPGRLHCRLSKRAMRCCSIHTCTKASSIRDTASTPVPLRANCRYNLSTIWSRTMGTKSFSSDPITSYHTSRTGSYPVSS
jgi:hypothetical protein